MILYVGGMIIQSFHNTDLRLEKYVAGSCLLYRWFSKIVAYLKITVFIRNIVYKN